MDVNEHIAKAYFEEVYSYVVKTNHHFKKKREKGTGPADIDLILIYPKDGKAPFGSKAICSVKGWQNYIIKFSEIKNKEIFEKKWKIFEEEELIAAKDFFGDDKFEKILILPPIHKNDKEKAKEYCLRNYKIHLLDFSDILIELMIHLSKSENITRFYDIEALQIIRMILINIIQISKENIEIQSSLLNKLGFVGTHIEVKCKFKNNPINKKLIITKK